MMPYLARQNVLAYNKEMFRNAGLGEFIAEGEITAWSLSEWTRILDALSASLPEGSFPMMMYAGSSQGDTHIVTLLRSAGSNIYDEAGHFSRHPRVCRRSGGFRTAWDAAGSRPMRRISRSKTAPVCSARGSWPSTW